MVNYKLLIKFLKLEFSIGKTFFVEAIKDSHLLQTILIE
jgi:hypothetical protein